MASYITSVIDNFTGRKTTPGTLDYTDTLAEDGTIRSPREAGYMQTRARFTIKPRRYHIKYDGLTQHDKNLIYKFEKNTVNGGADEFDFPLPTGGGTLSVRFDAPILFTPWERTNYLFWVVEFTITTVNGI